MDETQTGRSPIDPDFGLSSAQLQLWVGQQIDPKSPLYNMAFTLRFAGRVDRDAFRRAWLRVYDESDALRTSIDELGGRVLRKIRRPGSGGMEVLDLSTERDPEASFRAWAVRRAARPLALDGDLTDSVLVELGPDVSAWYLNLHHLITDAASTILVFRRVAAEYRRLTIGEARDERRNLSYYDAFSGLEKLYTDGERSRAAGYWESRQTVEGSSARRELYGVEVAPVRADSRRLGVRLDRDRSARLDEVAAEAFPAFTDETSRFALFSTLFALWLSKVRGGERVGFDAPTLNRPDASSREAIGVFVEMFPFSVEVRPDDTVRSLGERCFGEAASFLSNAFPGARPASASAVHDVVLNYFPGSFGPFGDLATEVEWIHPGAGDSAHAARLQIHDFDGRGRYALDLDVNTEVLDRGTHERALQHLIRALDAILDTPDQPLAALDLATPTELESRAEFNRPTDTGLPDRTVLERILQQVEADPEATALVQRERSWSYAELSEAIAALAGQLVERGVEPGDRVAIFSTRSIEAVVSILATLRAGAAYVPIDASSPPSRLRYVLEDCSAALLLVGTGVELPPGELCPRLSVTCGAHGAVSVEGRECPASDVSLPDPSLEDPAYLIYTSGSTGRPKGVPIAHGGLADYIDWAERSYVRGRDMSFALFTSIAFDLTVTSLYLPLVSGGTLVVYEEPPGGLDSSLMDVLGDNVVDFVKLTPSHLSLLRQLDLGSSRLSTMVVGGEDFRSDLARSIHRLFDGRVEIYNEYGPTEAVVGCMIHRFDPEVDDRLGVPIGRPADHVQIHVLDEHLQPTLEGVPGELCVARYGLASGYLGRDELSAERFVDNPFAPGERLYRTGDLARFARPGVLEYLGRVDRQVKISGFRVEPGEVEAALVDHPDVSAAAVVARSRPRGWVAGADTTHCARCGLESNYPGVVFDGDGVCGVCRSYEAIRDRADDYFEGLEDFQAIFERALPRGGGGYDCLSLLSGGKDSTYVLCRLVELGYKPLAFTLDNGYISEEAKDNIRRVVKALGVDHEFATTPAMNEIFRDSLVRFSNVCNGCFKTIYSLSVARARELGIPIIVTGLSRGQFFETRLTADLFRGDRFEPEDVDAAVLAARKAYHRVDDAVSRCLDVSMFESDEVFEEIEFVDFYRYFDVSLAELYATLDAKLPWERPTDTGRSTNCLINDAGIYIHKKERGFHNYSLPYSWDVRLGHKERGEALEELDDDIDVERVRRILDEVGYDEERLGRAADRAYLVGYYVADREIATPELRRHLAVDLPEHLVPRQFVRVDEIPLTSNGKLDEAALPSPEGFSGEEYVAPDGVAEETIAQIWRGALPVERVGAEDGFFELGGTSLAAMEVMLQVCDHFQIDLPLQTIFQHATVRKLAAAVEERLLEEIAALTDEEAEQQAAGSAGAGVP